MKRKSPFIPLKYSQAAAEKNAAAYEDSHGEARDFEYEARVRKTRFLFAVAVCAVTLVVLLFLFSPYFYVTDVHIVGNSRVSDEEIAARLEIDGSTHMLLYNTRAARRRLMENMYVGDVEFERIMPGRINVTITERRLTAYFEHMPGSFLFLDDHGRVLEVNTFFTEPLPVLEGLRFTSFRLGEILEVPDVAAFSVVVQYAQLLNHHGLIDRVSHMNVADSANIHIIIDRNMVFNVGGISNADEKVRTIIAILDTFPDAGRIPGFIDLREIAPQYFFEIWQ